MQLISAVNIEENFWKINPEIKFLSPFNKLYTSDESVNKEQSSKIMWAVYLHSDPDSKFFRMEEDEKRKEIKDNYLQDNKFKWSDVKDIIVGYETKLLSKLQLSYNKLLKKLEERDSFIMDTPYNERNAKTIDKMLTDSSLIYKQLQEIEDQLKSEKRQGVVKGGRKESLSEQKKL